MKTFDLKVIVSWFAAVLMALATLVSCDKAHIPAVLLDDSHTCRWSLCPYKGVTIDQRIKAVSDYVGVDLEGTDGYYIDLLHLQYPTEDADQLHDRLSGLIN